MAWIKDMSEHELEALQRECNLFCKRMKLDVAPLIVDGKPGPSTRRRIRYCRAMIGFVGKRRKTTAVDPYFLWRLARPRYVRKNHKVYDAKLVKRGMDRRKRWRKAHEANENESHTTTGVVQYDGRACAAWMVPHLQWARGQGWKGTLNSGWRDPVYSESLCLAMCGKPSCPGRCAGRSSNHSGSAKPHGAVDVTDYARFGQLMTHSPHEPKIHNALGAQDPVHFSVSGR